MINLTIDRQQISVEEGTSVLEAARQRGIDIPYSLLFERP
jgi:NADH dehydrogenase/NADH:ubiquinone oxidoreductase subunit G